MDRQEAGKRIGEKLGPKANRDSGISGFVGDLLEASGMDLYEKWFEHLQQLDPGSPVADSQVRDQMLEEIIPLVTEGNSLILGKKDKLLIEELLNKFLRNAHLLK